MLDELTLFASLRPDSEVLPADERAALRRTLFGSSSDGSGADAALGSPPSIADDPESTLIELERPVWQAGPRARRIRRGRHIVAIATAAAAVGFIAVVISRDDANAPADTPIPLEDPSRDEVAAASNAGVYEPGNGPTQVSASRRWVTLRRCTIGVPSEERRPCDGPDGWAYLTGSVDAPGVHYGLLGTGLVGTADDLVLSALDDRLFVASAASFSQDPPSAPLAWLIDSLSGQRGQLTWQDEPTTRNAPGQVLLFPAFDTSPGKRFLPRVVDRRDWTLRPLRVPEDATAALAINQPGSDRIWIGTAPEDGHVGLAYTDDGGASWTDVELPPSLRPTSAEMIAAEAADADDLLVVAAAGDHVAVTDAWGGATEVFVSADAGEIWNTVMLDPADGNGRRLYVLSDDRLIVVLSNDNHTIGILVSSSASDWSQLEVSDHSGFQSDFLAQTDSAVRVYHQGVVVHYDRAVCDDEGLQPPVSFSTDLTDWWAIPGLEFRGRC